jgi:hypothetical protein
MNKDNTTVSENQNSSDFFFTRTLEGIEFSDGKNAVKNHILNFDDANLGSIKNLKLVLEYKIKYDSFSLERTDKFAGLLVQCNRGDGISFLIKKIQKLCKSIISENNSDNSLKYNSTELIQKNDFDFPAVGSLVGRERKLLKLAGKNNLTDNVNFLFFYNIIAIIVFLVSFVPDLDAFIAKNEINVEIPTWLLRLIEGVGVVIALLAINRKYFAKLIAGTKKDRDEFIKKLLSDGIKKDTNYQPFVNNVVEYILQKQPNRKVLIIDDIAALDQFSQDVLFELIELTKNSKRYFWIIFSSAQEITQKIQLRDFYPLTLLPLKSSEKEKFCKQLKLPDKNTDFNTITEIIGGRFDEKVQEALKQQLTTLKQLNLDLFNFIYLLALNDFPRKSEYRKNNLIKKIAPRREARERDIFLKKFFAAIPDNTRLKDLFNEEKIKPYYTYNTETQKISINNDVSNLITNSPFIFNYSQEYRYGHGYWGLLWYFAYRDNPQTYKIQKISHHLQNADSSIDNIAVRVILLEANLFTAEKSLSFLLKHEIDKILEHTLEDLNIQYFTDADTKKDSIAKVICESFLNFDTSFNGKRNRFEDFECKKLYDFINKKDLSATNKLLDDKGFASISGYVVAYLLEQYWEKCFFLYIFSKERTNYSLIPTISEELKGLTECITPYFTNTKDKTSLLYLFNLSVFIWIDYIRLISNAEVSKEDILQRIENFLEYYKKVNIVENDIYQQTNLQEAICLVSTIALLMLKKQDIEDKNKLLELLKNLKTIFKEVEIDATKGFDEIQRFLLIHSLLWKNTDFNVRQSMISAVMIQLFLFENDNDKITDDIIAKAKEIAHITEQSGKNRLSTLLNFSLYQNSELFGEKLEKEHRSSYFFQQALTFTDTNQISAFQFEYLYFAIQKCWYLDSDKLKNIVRCFVRCGTPYFDSIVTKTCEYPESYLFITNCLNRFNADELKINNDAIIMAFFDKILETAKEKKGIENFSDTECIWKNHKFSQLSKEDKLIEKQAFENYWEKNHNNPFYGEALGMLLEIETNSVQQTTMDNCYKFIVESVVNDTFGSYNFNFRTACCFVNEKKRMNAQDDEYKYVLDILVQNEPHWEDNYGNMLNDSVQLYETLYENTNNHKQKQKYDERHKHYQLLETKVQIDNFEITDSFGLFYNLWNIFKNDLGLYNDISKKEEQFIENGKYKQWLESISDLGDIIRDNEISRKYLYIHSYRHEQFEGRGKLLQICNDLAVKSFLKLNQLILKTPSNRKYLERIKALFEQVQENYDDEE